VQVTRARHRVRHTLSWVGAADNVCIVSCTEYKHKAKHILLVQLCMYEAIRRWLVVLKTEGLLLTGYNTISIQMQQYMNTNTTMYEWKYNNIWIHIQQCMHADTTWYEYRYNSVWIQIQHYMNINTTILEYKYNQKQNTHIIQYKPQFPDSTIHVCRWWAHAAARHEHWVATAVRARRSGAARCLSL